LLKKSPYSQKSPSLLEPVNNTLMIQFDWSEKIQNHVFKSWLDTGGSGVRIAVLDTGVDLAHPALKHLDKAGRKFNAALPGFNPAKPLLGGNDDVTDAHRKKGHGTQCVCVLTSKEEGENALRGFLPEAEVFILKINTVDHKFFRVKDFLRGLEAAANLGVDIVVASVSYALEDLALEGISQAEIDRVFGLLAASGAVLFASLPNRSDGDVWKGLPAANFPSLRPEVVNVGAFSKGIFEKRKAEIDAEANIHFLVSNASANFCKIKNEYVQEPISSSYGTYLVAGVAALYLASIKKREKESYKPRPMGDFLKGLSQKFVSLREAQEWDGTLPVLFKTSAVKSGAVDTATT